MAEIEFDIDTYEPLPVYKPTATRAADREGAGRCSIDAERPLIVAGGGIINADASDLLVEFAETHRRAGHPDADGLGHHPRRPPADGRHVRACRPRTATATPPCSRRDFVLGIGNRWANRHTGSARRLHARAASSSTSTSSRRRSAACSRPTSASSPTPRRALELFVEVAARMEGRRQAAATAPAGSSECQRAQGARCSARPTSTTCRSSRSASTRR